MTELGIESELILKNSLIIRSCWTVWRLRTSRQHPILQKGLVKAQKSWLLFLSPLSFLPSADLDLYENQGRIDKTTNNGDDNNGHRWDSDTIIGGNIEESANLSFAF